MGFLVNLIGQEYSSSFRLTTNAKSITRITLNYDRSKDLVTSNKELPQRYGQLRCR